MNNSKGGAYCYILNDSFRFNRIITNRKSKYADEKSCISALFYCEVFAIAKVKLQAVKFVLCTSEVKFATLPLGKTSLTK